MKKNILILGSGGRESAFAWKFSKDKNIDMAKEIKLFKQIEKLFNQSKLGKVL